MQTLVILVGNIGNGKTTIAKKYVKKGYIAVSRDSVRQMFAAEDYMFNPDIEPIVFKVERHALLGLLQEGLNVVVDETNIVPKSRSRTIALGQEYHCKIIAHVVHRLTRDESVKRRMEGNPRGYTAKKWGEVWDLFDKGYNEPILKEGFHEIILEQETGRAKHIKSDPDSKTRRSRD